MSALSDAAETLVANFIANTATATRPTAWYLGLFTAAPSDSGGGTEVSGSGYARQAITFGAASGAVVSNTSTHTFTASGGSFGRWRRCRSTSIRAAGPPTLSTAQLRPLPRLRARSTLNGDCRALRRSFPSELANYFVPLRSRGPLRRLARPAGKSGFYAP